MHWKYFGISRGGSDAGAWGICACGIGRGAVDGVGTDAGAMMVLPVSGVESTGATSSGSESDNSSTWAFRDMVEDLGGVMGSGKKKVRERRSVSVLCGWRRPVGGRTGRLDQYNLLLLPTVSTAILMSSVYIQGLLLASFLVQVDLKDS